jgi:anti-sigma factor RsiW
MNDLCNNLDDYLSGNLAEDEATAFSEHQRECGECREAVEQQQWINNLLQSPLVRELEPAPSVRILALRSRDQLSRRSSRALAATLSVAAAVVVAIGWTALHDHTLAPADQHATGRPSGAIDQQHAKPGPRAWFVASSGSITVPLESRSSDVTVVRVYPAFQPQFDDATAAVQPEAATFDMNSDYLSNGG